MPDSVLAALGHSPLILANPKMPSEAYDYIREKAYDMNLIYVVGGEDALSTSFFNDLLDK